METKSTTVPHTVKNILVVDDDDVMREKVRRILRSEPYSIIEASSGIEAKKLLVTQDFDCILLDNRLGDLEGLDLLPYIQNLLKRPCPIIMITGTGDERLVVEAMRGGAYDYINKQQLNIEHLSSVIAAGLQWAELEKKLRSSQERINHLSLYDGLTDLPNRHLFFDRLEQSRHLALRENSGFLLVMMDLNMFKEVNDTFGHAAGDEILKQVGIRLAEVARNTDSFARLGGDEFAGILGNVQTLPDAINIINKIIDVINTPFFLTSSQAVLDHPISIGISIGATFFSQANNVDPQSLLAQADSAMYKAKFGSRGFEFFQKEKYKKQMAMMTIAGHLSAGIKNQEFRMEYQPQIDLQTGACCGLEALIRWKSASIGEVSPSEFIKVAERSTLIVELSYWVFDNVLAQVARWNAQGLQLPISINLSVKMLDQDNVVENISKLLLKYQVPPQQLTIEITETALLSNPSHAGDIIKALSQLGIRISIDDFGTGYTSFRYMREFIFDEIKVDQLFVTTLNPKTRDESIVKSFVALSNGFDVTLIAEGVEDITKLKHVRSLGCARAQGYFISRSIAAEQMETWLDAWKVRALTLFN